MSLHEYLTSQAISAGDPPFYSLIMAAMRQADSDNLIKLRAAWPEVWAELQARYNAPLGILPRDTEDPKLVARSTVDWSGKVTTRCPDDD